VLVTRNRLPSVVDAATAAITSGTSLVPTALTTSFTAQPQADGIRMAAGTMRRSNAPPGPDDVARRIIPVFGRSNRRPVLTRSRPIAAGSETPITGEPPK
jgi:hypothetical protein